MQSLRSGESRHRFDLDQGASGQTADTDGRPGMTASRAEHIEAKLRGRIHYGAVPGEGAFSVDVSA